MDDAIEICSGCGKLPRSIDMAQGHFSCSRCGNTNTIHVTSLDFEKVSEDLDARFHSRMLKQKFAAASSEPIVPIKSVGVAPFAKPITRKAKKAKSVSKAKRSVRPKKAKKAAKRRR